MTNHCDKQFNSTCFLSNHNPSIHPSIQLPPLKHLRYKHTRTRQFGDRRIWKSNGAPLFRRHFRECGAWQSFTSPSQHVREQNPISKQVSMEPQQKIGEGGSVGSIIPWAEKLGGGIGGDGGCSCTKDYYLIAASCFVSYCRHSYYSSGIYIS